MVEAPGVEPNESHFRNPLQNATLAFNDSKWNDKHASTMFPLVPFDSVRGNTFTAA